MLDGEAAQLLDGLRERARRHTDHRHDLVRGAAHGPRARVVARSDAERTSLDRVHSATACGR